MRLFLIPLFFLLFFLVAFPSIDAQNNKLDSVRVLLQKSDDTTKVNLLNSIALECAESDFDTSIAYLSRALALAQKIDFTKGVINAYSYMGYTYFYHRLYDKSLDNYVQVERIGQSTGNQKLTADYNNMAACYYNIGNYEKALEYYLKDLRKQENKGSKEYLSFPLNGIGGVYLKTKQYDNALIYFKRSLSLSVELKDKTGIALTFKNIGNVYHELNNGDTALVYYNKALHLNEELGNKSEVASTLMNIGIIHKQKKNYEEALGSYEKALLIQEELGNKKEIATALLNIGNLEYERDNIDKAINCFQKSIVFSQLVGDKGLISNANEGLSDVYFKKGDYKKAYDYHKIYTSLKDSVYTEASAKAIAEMKTKYDTEGKEKEITLLTKDKTIRESELQNQRNVRNGLIIGVVLLLLVALLAYNRYRIKQKASKEIAEKNKEITESISYAKRIQSSFLTSEKYISQRLSDYFIYYNPRNIVSGDFYWLMDKNNTLYVCTADCTGHGIPGAFMSLISMGILNEIIYSKTHLLHTDDILNELRRIIIMAVNPEGSSQEGKDGMDAVLCRFDFNKMELEYSAANNSFFIIRNGELLVFKPDKMPVGKHIGIEKPFTRNTVSLEKGDCIYTFSDGYADQFGGPNDKKFQSKRLKEMFLNNCHKPMSIQKDIYEKTIKEWQGATEQVDDILVMGIRV